MAEINEHGRYQLESPKISENGQEALKAKAKEVSAKSRRNVTARHTKLRKWMIDNSKHLPGQAVMDFYEILSIKIRP